MVNTDDGHSEGVLVDISLQEFIDDIGVNRCFVGEDLGKAGVGLQVGPEGLGRGSRIKEARFSRLSH